VQARGTKGSAAEAKVDAAASRFASTYLQEFNKDTLVHEGNGRSRNFSGIDALSFQD
jgi:hypothetical protein